MKKVIIILAVLIAGYLILSHAWEANALLGTLSDASLKGISVLQGRNVKGVTS